MLPKPPVKLAGAIQGCVIFSPKLFKCFRRRLERILQIRNLLFEFFTLFVGVRYLRGRDASQDTQRSNRNEAQDELCPNDRAVTDSSHFIGTNSRSAYGG